VSALPQSNEEGFSPEVTSQVTSQKAQHHIGVNPPRSLNIHQSHQSHPLHPAPFLAAGDASGAGVSTTVLPPSDARHLTSGDLSGANLLVGLAHSLLTDGGEFA
jgi:hypothetical protein